jgi:predicted nucleotidyltransferase
VRELAGDLQARLSSLPRRHADLHLLLLFGSRARGDARDASDWDFAYVADGTFDVAALQLDLVDTLGTDQLDVVNLEQAGALLRFRAARDGIVVFARAPLDYERFWLAAVQFWCEAGPTIRAAYEGNLAELG